jgi:hypothetical protein
MIGCVTRPSARLIHRVERDFPAHVDEVLTALGTIPDTLPLAENQSAERLQAAVLLRAAGDRQKLHNALRLAQEDWRDLLMYTGLENRDWPRQLTNEFGEA